MDSKKLKKAPLQEVVFEVRWLGKSEDNRQYDEGYDFAQGVFREKLKSDFSIHTNLFQEGIIAFGMPSHQYWKGNQEWPVVQHGQCIMAINDIEQNYVWEDTFKPRIIDTLNKLSLSYETERKFNQFSLLYIDLFPNVKDIMAYLDYNFNIFYVNNIEEFANPSQFNCSFQFKLGINETMHISFSSANLNPESDVFDTLVMNLNYVYSGALSHDELIAKIEIGHAQTSEFFKKLLKSEFYDSLK